MITLDDMSTINIKTKNNDLIASANLGEGVINFEGNYYFEPSKIDLSLLIRKENQYHCPIKNGDADYFYLEGSTREIGWVYNKVENDSFKNIQGWIAFYARSSEVIEVEIIGV